MKYISGCCRRIATEKAVGPHIPWATLPAFGRVDDAVREMDRHINQCEPCQAFLASLKQAVAEKLVLRAL